MDIVVAYESYCNFIDLLDDNDIIVAAGMEAATAEEKAEAVNNVKTTQKKNGLIAAVAALLEGVVKFFVRLLGLEEDSAIPAEIELYEMPGNINPEKLIDSANKVMVALKGTTPGTSEYEKLVEKLESITAEYEEELKDSEAKAAQMKKASKAAPRKCLVFKTKNAKQLGNAAKALANQNKMDGKVLAQFQKVLNLYKQTLTTFNAKDAKKLDKAIAKADKKVASAEKDAEKLRSKNKV